MSQCKDSEHRFNVDPQGPILTRFNVPKVLMLITPCAVCGFIAPKPLLDANARAMQMLPDQILWKQVDRLPGDEDPQKKAAAGNAVQRHSASGLARADRGRARRTAFFHRQ